MVTMTGGQITTVRTNPVRISVNNIPSGTMLAGFFVGETDPASAAPGTAVGVAYLNTVSGDVFQLGANMQWAKVGNVRGPAGSEGEISEATIEVIKNLAATSVLDDLNSESDLPDIPNLASVFQDALD